MGRKRKGTPREKQRKKVNVKMIAREHAGKLVHVYELLGELVDQHHPHLSDAKIALAWRYGWRGDPDGRLQLGQAKKGSDLDRELHGFDFVILLNHEAWNISSFTEAHMEALIDHLLCRCQVSRDSNGEPKTDDNGRTVYRVRKPDIQEFTEIVSRRGLWTADLEKFAERAIEHSQRPLLAADFKKTTAKGKKLPAPEGVGLHGPSVATG